MTQYQRQIALFIVWPKKQVLSKLRQSYSQIQSNKHFSHRDPYLYDPLILRYSQGQGSSGKVW